MSNATAQLMLVSWIERNIGVTDINIRFNKKEALITDENGETMTIKYNSNTREVYVT